LAEPSPELIGIDPGTAGVLRGTGVGLSTGFRSALEPSVCGMEEGSAAAGEGIGLGMPSTKLESAEPRCGMDPCALDGEDASGSAKPLERTVEAEGSAKGGRMDVGTEADLSLATEVGAAGASSVEVVVATESPSCALVLSVLSLLWSVTGRSARKGGCNGARSGSVSRLEDDAEAARASI
jgi:hypothetical protein